MHIIYGILTKYASKSKCIETKNQSDIFQHFENGMCQEF